MIKLSGQSNSFKTLLEDFQFEKEDKEAEITDKVELKKELVITLMDMVDSKEILKLWAISTSMRKWLKDKI
jgi:hypothetical protein